MNQTLFVLIIQLFLLSSASGGPRYVSSVEEFYEHMRLHRERVKVLGIELFKSHPELFEGLSIEKVSGVLEAHDLAKITAGSLAPDGHPFYRTLYTEGYGKKLDGAIVDSLNVKDKEFMEKALKSYGLDKNPELRAMIIRIEKIADSVDRGMSPVSPEEFGRKMNRASTYLESDSDRKLARELEQKYRKVVAHLNYKKLTPSQMRSMADQLCIKAVLACLQNLSLSCTQRFN